MASSFTSVSMRLRRAAVPSRHGDGFPLRERPAASGGVTRNFGQASR
jgi:hypothetical protein